MSPDLREQLQSSLGDRYIIDRELGGGGMSRVFVATETALHRQVVVKVLAPELALGLSAERFAREIELAAQLQDPHIVPVLSAGLTNDGLPYFTMPFVAGQSLRGRLAQLEPGVALPLTESTGILRDVALALEYAHAQRVVHRDIKPENVLLAGRTAVVADFGIAKAVNAAREHGVASTSPVTLTSVGQSIGTPGYMAPEQAAGDAVDHRADLYAWGVMAYELLAARHPFGDKTTTAQLIAAHIAEVPVSLGVRQPGLPTALAQIVMQCLAKEPSARPASATALVQALETPASSTSALQHSTARRSRRLAWSVGAVAILAAAALGAALVSQRSRGREATASPDASVAVLPFEHQGDTTDAYLTDGITDEIRGKLIGVRNLTVIARTSSVGYRGTRKSPRDITRELGVRYLLTGTVRVIGTGDARRVLVRPELVEVTSDGLPTSRWQKPFDVAITDAVTVQGEVAGQVVSAMEVAVTSDDRSRILSAPTRDALAYELHLRGRAEVNGGKGSDPAAIRRAISLFERAVARDTSLVDAWADMTVWAGNLYLLVPSGEAADMARRAAERALALDPQGVAGLRAMGLYQRAVRRDVRAALPYYERVYRATPNDSRALINLSNVLNDLGRHDESLRHLNEAVRLDPLNVGTWESRGSKLIDLGRFDEAERSLLRARALAPSSVLTAVLRFQAAILREDLPAAQRVIADADEAEIGDPVLATLGYFGMSWALDTTNVRRLLALDADAFGDSTQWATTHARHNAWRGDSAGARAWGDSASRWLREKFREIPDDPVVALELAEALAFTGHASDALTLYRDATRRLRARASTSRREYIGALPSVATVAVLAGDRETALSVLEEYQSVSMRSVRAELRLDPTWAPIRNEPRFRRLLEKSGTVKPN